MIAKAMAKRPADRYTTCAELIGDVVFDSVHAGPLRIAHYTEPFALLVAQLAH